MQRVLILFALSFSLFAAPAIRELADRKLWVIDTGKSTYVLGVNQRNELQHVYWGSPLQRDADLRPAHAGEGWASFDSSESRTPEARNGVVNRRPWLSGFEPDTGSEH